MYLFNLPKKFAILLINIYQCTLSPDHGIFKARHPHGFCRFYPSCSQYAKEVIDKFGVVKGLYLSIKRVLKCNPWVEPSIDNI